MKKPKKSTEQILLDRHYDVYFYSKSDQKMYRLSALNKHTAVLTDLFDCTMTSTQRSCVVFDPIFEYDMIYWDLRFESFEDISSAKKYAAKLENMMEEKERLNRLRETSADLKHEMDVHSDMYRIAADDVISSMHEKGYSGEELKLTCAAIFLYYDYDGRISKKNRDRGRDVCAENGIDKGQAKKIAASGDGLSVGRLSIVADHLKQETGDDKVIKGEQNVSSQRGRRK